MPSQDQINVLLIGIGAILIGAFTHNIGLAIGVWLIAMAIRPLTNEM